MRWNQVLQTLPLNLTKHGIDKKENIVSFVIHVTIVDSLKSIIHNENDCYYLLFVLFSS